MIAQTIRLLNAGWQYAYFVRVYLLSRLGQKSPLLGGMKITHACNLRCVHCPFWQKPAASLLFAQALSCMLTLYQWGVRLLIIEGGEPFLWRDGDYTLRDLVNEARKIFFSVGVTTNGTFPLDVAADILWVSIDGLPETYAQIRGDHFRQVIANIEASRHPKIYAHITINRLNWQDIPELVRFLTPKVKGITIQFHYPYATEAEDDALFLPFEQRRQVLDRLIDLKRQGYPVADSYACLQALQTNRWTCQPWLIASVDPDGSLTRGCYVQNRGRIACAHCGFAAHTEISLAYKWGIEAIFTGKKIFGRIYKGNKTIEDFS